MSMGMCTDILIPQFTYLALETPSLHNTITYS